MQTNTYILLDEEIKKKCRLIALFDDLLPFQNEFAGIKISDHLYKRINSDGTEDIVGDLPYSLSYDWILPVLNKIKNMGCSVSVSMEKNECICSITNATLSISKDSQDNPLVPIFDCVVEFISKKYNIIL